jgi:hypothetical protein
MDWFKMAQKSQMQERCGYSNIAAVHKVFIKILSNHKFCKRIIDCLLPTNALDVNFI